MKYKILGVLDEEIAKLKPFIDNKDKILLEIDEKIMQIQVEKISLERLKNNLKNLMGKDADLLLEIG